MALISFQNPSDCQSAASPPVLLYIRVSASYTTRLVTALFTYTRDFARSPVSCAWYVVKRRKPVGMGIRCQAMCECAEMYSRDHPVSYIKFDYRPIRHFPVFADHRCLIQPLQWLRSSPLWSFLAEYSRVWIWASSKLLIYGQTSAASSKTGICHSITLAASYFWGVLDPEWADSF